MSEMTPEAIFDIMHAGLQPTPFPSTMVNVAERIYERMLLSDEDVQRLTIAARVAKEWLAALREHSISIEALDDRAPSLSAALRELVRFFPSESRTGDTETELWSVLRDQYAWALRVRDCNGES